jgi:hypothetical protein
VGRRLKRPAGVSYLATSSFLRALSRGCWRSCCGHGMVSAQSVFFRSRAQSFRALVMYVCPQSFPSFLVQCYCFVCVVDDGLWCSNETAVIDQLPPTGHSRPRVDSGQKRRVERCSHRPARRVAKHAAQHSVHRSRPCSRAGCERLLSARAVHCDT